MVRGKSEFMSVAAIVLAPSALPCFLINLTQIACLMRLFVCVVLNLVPLRRSRPDTHLSVRCICCLGRIEMPEEMWVERLVNEMKETVQERKQYCRKRQIRLTMALLSPFAPATLREHKGGFRIEPSPRKPGYGRRQ